MLAALTEQVSRLEQLALSELQRAGHVTAATATDEEAAAAQPIECLTHAVMLASDAFQACQASHQSATEAAAAAHEATVAQLEGKLVKARVKVAEHVAQLETARAVLAAHLA